MWLFWLSSSPLRLCQPAVRDIMLSFCLSGCPSPLTPLPACGRRLYVIVLSVCLSITPLATGGQRHYGLSITPLPACGQRYYVIILFVWLSISSYSSSSLGSETLCNCFVCLPVHYSSASLWSETSCNRFVRLPVHYSSASLRSETLCIQVVHLSGCPSSCCPVHLDKLALRVIFLKILPWPTNWSQWKSPRIAPLPFRGKRHYVQ